MMKRKIQITDKELLSRIKEKDEAAFQMLYLRYHSFVTKRLYFYIRRRELAEDLAQDFWAAVWENPLMLKTNDEECVFCYLYSILDSVCKKTIMEQARKESMFVSYENISEEWNLADGRPTAEEEMGMKEMRDFLKRSCMKLPLHERKILYSYLDCRPVAEVACTLRLSASCVYTCFRKSVGKLRMQWRKYVDE